MAHSRGSAVLTYGWWDGPDIVFSEGVVSRRSTGGAHSDDVCRTSVFF